MTLPTKQDVIEAKQRLSQVIEPTPLEYNDRLSKLYGAKIYLKREDLQPVRSYKIRGAYNALQQLSAEQRRKGIVCASAGNHAQGVAWACHLAGIPSVIFMPSSTPAQKVNRVRYFGNGRTTIKLVGDNYDQAAAAAQKHADSSGAYFLHAFNDRHTIAGQGSIALEVIEQLGEEPDAFVLPVGGGGVLAGASLVAEASRLYGVESSGAASLAAAFKAGKPVSLTNLDTFVDGASVARVGDNSFEVIKQHHDVGLLQADSGQLCSEILDLYQDDGIIAEPAGALSVAGLGRIRDSIKGQTVVCYITGGNNDISRYPEIIERSLRYRGLKHYFLVEFSQRPGQLRDFVDKALGETDDITRFEYMKRNNKESGAALVGIELADKNHLSPLLKRMQKHDISYELLEDNHLLYDFLV